MLAKIKNLSRFQHYSDRRPPWIKLHREILDNGYARLSCGAWRLGLELTMLASESTEGVVNVDLAELTWRLRRKILQQDVDDLFSVGYLIPEQDDSSTLAPRLQCGGSEAESEAEAETETLATGVARGFGFDEWWKTYRDNSELPMRDKAKALAKWRALGLAGEADKMVKKLKLQFEYRLAKAKEGKFCPRLPDPHRYLNRKLWLEELR